MSLVRPLLHDRVDIIGDVHGEIDALRTLLAHLHVDVERGRVERPLVFVGDLVDRGPDSVAVVELVAHLVAEGAAQVVLGNHEHNLLRSETKEGNSWFLRHERADEFFAPDGTKRPFSSRAATAAERARLLEFFWSLPLALEGKDLRVVHADWHPPDIERARTMDLRAFDKLLREGANAEFDLSGAPTDEQIRNRAVPLGYHHGLAQKHAAEQNREPIRVLVSGREQPLRAIDDPSEDPVPFLSGKYRFACRAKWWEMDDDERAVVFGHYWRRCPATRELPGVRVPTRADVTDGIPPFAWFGKRRQAFCVDYSVGKRFEARAAGIEPAAVGVLGALRWPERTVVFDHDPTRIPTHV